MENNSFLEGLVGAFESLAVEKKLELSFHCKEKEIVLFFEPEKMEKVIVNLLSNTICAANYNKKFRAICNCNRLKSPFHRWTRSIDAARRISANGA